MSRSQNHQLALAEERLGLKIAARLSEASDAVPHDIEERLRHARMLALSRRKQPRTATADAWLPLGQSAALGGPTGQEASWWQRWAMVLPVLVLVIGLVAIDRVLDDKTAKEIAKIDAALLVDDLPPVAYTDAGFLQFLRLNHGTTR